MRNNKLAPKILSLQEEAELKIKNLTWPTRMDEEWRRSDPALFPFDMLEEKLQDTPTESEVESYQVFNNSIKTAISEMEGVTFTPWEDENADAIYSFLHSKCEVSLDKIDIWRMTQFWAGGILQVKSNTVIDKPLIFTLNGLSEESVLCPLLVINVEGNASIPVDIRITGDAFFSLGIYVNVEKQGKCHINQLQNTSLDSYVINSLYSDCAEESEFTHTSGQLGGVMAVDRVHTNLLGTHANIHLNGFYYAIEDQLVDMRTYQQHEAVDANSRSLYHGVAVDESHSVYRGLIGVGDDAIETDAYLTNNNLLLSEEARMDSIPCLNIKTNDVRCSHGSTTGTLNPEHIFYLQSRGLSDTDAKELLIDGFFQVIYDSTFEETNEISQQLIKERIRKSV